MTGLALSQETLPRIDEVKTSMTQSQTHVPVMLKEVIRDLAPCQGGFYVDATWGRGGYCQALLNAADCHVIAIDWDPAAVACARLSADVFIDLSPQQDTDDHAMAKTDTGLIYRASNPRFLFAKSCFSRLDEVLQYCQENIQVCADLKGVDGIVFDLGLSSPQLDEQDRGFSFRFEGSLDMRMQSTGMTAAEWLANAAEADIADALWKYGDERHSRRIACHVIKSRTSSPITSTTELAKVVHKAIGPRSGNIDSATRTFQAIRILINDELTRLERGLASALDNLAPGGRLVVVSYHSGEDRIVKRCFNSACGQAAIRQTWSRIPVQPLEEESQFKLVYRGIVRPSDDEIKTNPRARSGRLRVIEKINKHGEMASDHG